SFCLALPPAPSSTLFPYTTLFRSHEWLLRRRRIRKPTHSAAADDLYRSLRLQGVRLQRCHGSVGRMQQRHVVPGLVYGPDADLRSEEHTSELQSRGHLVCRLLLEK